MSARTEQQGAGPAPPAKRVYRSPLREDQAEQTKERISKAAAPLFARQGYTRTSVRQIAAAAHVGVERIYAAGDKSAVFLRAFELSLRGTLDGAPLLELDGVKGALDAATLEDFLAVVVGFVVDSNRNAAPLWRAFVEAANAEPQLNSAYERHMTLMRSRARKVLDFVVERDLCPEPHDPRGALDGIWATLHPSQYDLLVGHAGWDHARYQAWLVTRITSILRTD